MAQEKAPIPAAEVGLNFSLMNFSPGAGATAFTSYGGSGTFVYNLNSIFSAVADVGAYHNPDSFHFDPTTYTYLFGPRVNLRRSRMVPYVQALFGGARQWTSFVNSVTGTSSPHGSFAAAFGGGVDVRMTDHVTVKPFQLDYLMTQLTDPWSTSGTQNNIRYTAGIVFTFGSK